MGECYHAVDLQCLHNLHILYTVQYRPIDHCGQDCDHGLSASYLGSNCHDCCVTFFVAHTVHVYTFDY